MPEDTNPTEEAIKKAEEELDRIRRATEKPMPGKRVINHPPTPAPKPPPDVVTVITPIRE